MRKGAKKFNSDSAAARFFAAALALCVWQAGAAALGNELLLVTPVAVARRLCELIVTADFWATLGFTFSRISLGFLFALALAYFCFWFAYRTPAWTRLERWGDPSYGTYLWGWPVQQLVVSAFPDARPWHNFLMAAAVAVGLGYLSWWSLERPALKLKDWRPRFLRRSMPRQDPQRGVQSP